jgi:hypothetical protein
MAGEDDAVGYAPARRLLGTLEAAGIDRSELWLHYFSIGGDVSEFEVDAYLHHSMLLPRLQRDLLAHAANELLADRRPSEAPYAEDLQKAWGPTGEPGEGSGGHSSIRDSDVMDHGDSDEMDEPDE